MAIASSSIESFIRQGRRGCGGTRRWHVACFRRIGEERLRGGRGDLTLCICRCPLCGRGGVLRVLHYYPRGPSHLQFPWLLRATVRSPLRSPAQVEGTQGFLPQPGKALERPSSTRLEARFPYKKPVSSKILVLDVGAAGCGPGISVPLSTGDPPTVKSAGGAGAQHACRPGQGVSHPTPTPASVHGRAEHAVRWAFT